MLELKEIKKFYPEPLQKYTKFLLREYLQVKILQIIYNSPWAASLRFMGGTCLRMIHENQRFSEDLDFDNIHLGEEDFGDISRYIVKELKREGYEPQMRTVMRGAWHCYIRFPKLLFESGLSGHAEEKILIQIDTEKQHYEYNPERIILNKFEIFTTIITVPLPILLSQKFFAILNRPRVMGRDFFDAVFLLGRKVSPDWHYLDAKAGVSDWDALTKKLLEVCKKSNMTAAARDVEPFLFFSEGKQKVLAFEDYIKGISL